MFDALDEFFDPGLRLPIGGREYRVESPSAAEGLRLRRLLLGDRTLDDEQELAEIRTLLGSTFEEMQAAGVVWPEIMHAGRAALLWFAVSPEVGEKAWGGDNPGNPLPPEPTPAPGANACATGSVAAN